MSTIQFDNIYLNQSRQSGQVRMAQSGLGWKPSEKGHGGSNKSTETFLLGSSELQAAFWSRAARGYEVRVQTKNKGVVMLDGFDVEDFNSVKQALKHDFNVVLESREHSLKGWNWGKADFGRSELVFNVSGKPSFEIPYSDVSNSNLVGKNEVAVEFNLQAAGERIKAGDELVEMRFYVPGTVSKTDETKDGSDSKEDDKSGDEVSEEVEQSAASAFYDSLKEKADIGLIAGDAIVSFTDILFLTPRGRYDIDMYHTSLRLRGKTYDYKIQYKTIQRLFLLPKPDDIHNILIIQLDPPLRQGQTRYPFLVIQFLKEEEMEVELNLEDEEFETKYADKLKRKYDQAAHEVVGQLFRGLTGRRITVPGAFTSTHGQAAVSCSLKASEGYLYPLEKCFMFIPKPTVYIPISEVASITFSRIGGSVSSSRTFDMTITLANNGGEHQFSNIDREEQSGLESFVKSKSIKIKNDMAEEQSLLAAALGDESDDSDVNMVQIDRGSADEDEESVDEDFQDEDDSDVAEEYDSNHDSNSDDDDNSVNSDEEAPPPKKKSRS